MMRTFTWRAAQLGPQMGSLVVASEARLLCAGLMVHVGSSHPPGLVARVLAEGAAALGGRLDDDVPADLATETAAALRRHRIRAPLLGLYAAAVLTPDTVRACTAGDLRIQLLRDGAVERSTRDHVYANEPAGTIPPDIVAALPHVASRMLGPEGATPPECVVWQAEPPYGILLSSSHHHRHGPAGVAPPWPDADFGYDAGLIIEARVT